MTKQAVCCFCLGPLPSAVDVPKGKAVAHFGCAADNPNVRVSPDGKALEMDK